MMKALSRVQDSMSEFRISTTPSEQLSFWGKACVPAGTPTIHHDRNQGHSYISGICCRADEKVSWIRRWDEKQVDATEVGDCSIQRCKRAILWNIYAFWWPGDSRSMVLIMDSRIARPVPGELPMVDDPSAETRNYPWLARALGGPS